VRVGMCVNVCVCVFWMLWMRTEAALCVLVVASRRRRRLGLVL